MNNSVKRRIPKFEDDVVDIKTIEVVKTAEEEAEDRILNVGLRPVMCYFSTNDIIGIAEWTPEQIISGYEAVELEPRVVEYAKAAKVAMSSIHSSAKSVLNSGIAVLDDCLSETSAMIDEYFKKDPIYTNEKKNDKEIHLVGGDFAKYIIANYEYLRDRHKDYLISHGGYKHRVAFGRFNLSDTDLYWSNIMLKRLYQYHPDVNKGVNSSRFLREPLPPPSTLPDIASSNGNVVLLAYYSSIVFSESFPPHLARYPVYVAEKGLRKPFPQNLIQHAESVTTHILISKNIFPFSERWVQFIARTYSSIQPYPVGRLASILAKYVGTNVFHGPLEDVVKYFDGDAIHLCCESFRSYKGITVTHNIKTTTPVENAILYAFIPKLVAAYCVDNYKIKALLFLWSSVATSLPKTFETFFSSYQTVEIALLFGDSAYIAFIPSTSQTAFASGDVIKIWDKIGSYILACFYQDWFSINPRHFILLKNCGDKIGLTIMPEGTVVRRVSDSMKNVEVEFGTKKSSYVPGSHGTFIDGGLDYKPERPKVSAHKGDPKFDIPVKKPIKVTKADGTPVFSSNMDESSPSADNFRSPSYAANSPNVSATSPSYNSTSSPTYVPSSSRPITFSGIVLHSKYGFKWTGVQVKGGGVKLNNGQVSSTLCKEDFPITHGGKTITFAPVIVLVSDQGVPVQVAVI